MSSQPLILTIALEPAAQQHFEQLRQCCFPPERKFIPAHITFFHHLPAAQLPAISNELTSAAAIPAFPLSITGLHSLGRSVAFQLESPTLNTLHARLARAFAAWLTPQDRQGYRPHIVIQNKIEPQPQNAHSPSSPPPSHPSPLTPPHCFSGATSVAPWQYLAEFPFISPTP